MTAPDATQQRLDPIGGLAVWPLAPVTALIVVTYAIFSVMTQAAEVLNPLFAALGVVALAGAAGILVWASLPENAPFQRRSSILLVGLALLAYFLEQAGLWGQNSSVHNDFGQVALGLLILALAPFRPWREIILLALGSAIIVATGAFVHASLFDTGAPPALYAILAAVQLLAPALAGAAYCRQVVTSIRVWQTDAVRSIRRTTEESRVTLAPAVEKQRLADLEVSVLPFLSAILDRGTVSAAEIDRARGLAEQVRRALVAETDHTWLDDLVARESAGLAAEAGGGIAALPLVRDDERRAARFTPRQRAAFGALVVMLCAQPGLDHSSLAIRLSPAHGKATPDGLSEPLDSQHAEGATVISLDASVVVPARQLRAALQPFTAVLRVEFTHVRVGVGRQHLTVHLDAEHREAGHRNADRSHVRRLSRPMALTRNEP
ncbi:hypothetical protein [Cryobacterium sp. CG_9.6]|uniref:hypothetical protein n=1 Tax=Cryobacterium sp. CG_9.6 TaxID=2760710 RepID=UPI0024761F03|nr:hypothetical protein [Cryobacterium sp. CG_9.6]MDH6235789.1 hypothetical protein [Cryobacterium sp. CG_9.6]